MMFDLRASPAAPRHRARAAGTAALTASIYDDHVLARSGLANLLGAEAVEVLREAPIDFELASGGTLHRPSDVTLVGVGGRGVELARLLTQEYDATVLLILDSPADPAGSLALFATGAAGSICRQCPGERVLAAVTALAEGRGISACAHHHPPEANVAPPLSERERLVAAELARGMQTEDIAAALCISPHTVRTHVRNIKRKLGARTTVQAVALALATEALSPTAIA